MKNGALVVAMLLLPCGLWAQKARAELKDSKGEVVGTAIFTPADHGVRMSLNVRNLPPGEHGMHIHEVGKCDPPDFKTAGAHFNPEGRKHGTQNPAGAHAGDMDNLTVRPDGTARIRIILHSVTLGKEASSLLKPGGTALVIHADKDDLKTDPTGNSGARIVCGVILGQ